MDKFKQLMEVVTDGQKTELSILHNAHIRCAKKYNEEPTLANKRDWDAAKNGLDSVVALLWLEHTGSDDGAIPANRLEAVSWLQAQGYKIAKTRFYSDCKKGLVVMRPDGSILPRELLRYAGAVALEKLASAGSGENHLDDLSGLQEKKLKKEIEKLDWDNKRKAFEYDLAQSKYLPRSDFERELAGRAVVLDSGLRRMFAAEAARMIALVSGKAEKTPELTAFLNGALDDLFRTYASTETYQVMVLPGADGDAEAKEDSEDREEDAEEMETDNETD